MKNQTPPQPVRPERMEARRVQVNPSNIWSTEMFSQMVEKICNDEINAMVQFGNDPPDEIERSDMRMLAIQNINAYAVPAGNA